MNSHEPKSKLRFEPAEPDDGTSGQVGQKLNKSKLRMEKAEAELGAARDKLALRKSPKKPGLVRNIGSTLKAKAWMYAHGKVYAAEHENVGIKAAHRSELAGESAARSVRRFAVRRFRSRPVRQVRKLEQRNVKARATFNFRQAVRDNPGLRKARMCKQRQFAGQAARRFVALTKRAGHILGRAAALNPKTLPVALAALLLAVTVQSCVGGALTVGQGLLGAIGGTSYFATAADIDEATIRYTYWETGLQYRIIHVERDHPGYDEYRFAIGEIWHNPQQLVAFLTAVYDDFTYAGARATLYEIFNAQYTLSFARTTETRRYIDSDGERGYYEWRVLHVTLAARPFAEVLRSRMDDEQAERFGILMLTGGNRQYLASPFAFNWRPFVSSLYGYRICPLDGVTRERHWGLDIALPEGTPILAGQGGTVTFAGSAGGYGLLVTLDNGAGLVSRYAHCSVIYVTVGQTVSAGDVIARVGNTGNSTGAHLHVEIIKHGRHLNPLIFTATNHN